MPFSGTVGYDLDFFLEPDAEFLVYPVLGQSYEREDVGRFSTPDVHDEVRVFWGYHAAAHALARKAAFSDKFRRRDHRHRVGFYGK